MRAVFNFRIKKVRGMDFRDFEKDPLVRKQFVSNCESICKALKKHFRKYSIEVEVDYKLFEEV